MDGWMDGWMDGAEITEVWLCAGVYVCGEEATNKKNGRRVPSHSSRRHKTVPE